MSTPHPTAVSPHAERTDHEKTARLTLPGLSLFRMAAPLRLALVLVPLALLWAAIIGLLT